MRGTRYGRAEIGHRNRIIPAHAGNSDAPTPNRGPQPDHPRACGELVLSRPTRASETDHPRACGELDVADPTTNTDIGSSPRMRGTLLDVDRHPTPARIIPAHAGNSPGVAAHRWSSPDHPRACGELSRRSRSSLVVAGSSPRMRGTPDPSYGITNCPRIIPAHAGNSSRRSGRGGCHADHPRACGELAPTFTAIPRADGSSPRMRGTHSSRRRTTSLMTTDHPRACGELSRTSRAMIGLSGSSPRMRGTPEKRRLEPCVGRIIPAHAGNSAQTIGACLPQPDHPRACGELPPGWVTAEINVGSSPRMRGTHVPTIVIVGGHRIIPAHAGNSPMDARTGYQATDHPRACGELPTTPPMTLPAFGSSPRMRGTHASPRRDRGPLRIIPAHAGNSQSESKTPAFLTDHPRACGELVLTRERIERHAGSSPRMRGTHLLGFKLHLVRRIIPAHAGNSLYS